MRNGRGRGEVEERGGRGEVLLVGEGRGVEEEEYGCICMWLCECQSVEWN